MRAGFRSLICLSRGSPHAMFFALMSRNSPLRARMCFVQHDTLMSLRGRVSCRADTCRKLSHNGQFMEMMDWNPTDGSTLVEEVLTPSFSRCFRYFGGCFRRVVLVFRGVFVRFRSVFWSVLERLSTRVLCFRSFLTFWGFCSNKQQQALASMTRFERVPARFALYDAIERG